MKSLSFFEEAAEEIEQEREWYRERSVLAEASFQRELDHAVESVLEAPARWPKYIAGTRIRVFHLPLLVEERRPGPTLGPRRSGSVAPAAGDGIWDRNLSMCIRTARPPHHPNHRRVKELR